MRHHHCVNETAGKQFPTLKVVGILIYLSLCHNLEKHFYQFNLPAVTEVQKFLKNILDAHILKNLVTSLNIFGLPTFHFKYSAQKFSWIWCNQAVTHQLYDILKVTWKMLRWLKLIRFSFVMNMFSRIRYFTLLLLINCQPSCLLLTAVATIFAHDEFS